MIPEEVHSPKFGLAVELFFLRGLSTSLDEYKIVKVITHTSTATKTVIIWQPTQQQGAESSSPYFKGYSFHH